MKNIYLTKAGNYRVQLFLHGKCRHLGTYRTLDVAQRIALNYQRQKLIDKLEALK